MPIYKYEGTNSAGKTVKGIKEASSEKELYVLLKQDNIYMHSAKSDAPKEITLRRLKSKELADFSRSIGTLQRTGIPVMKSISMMLEQDISKNTKAIYEKIYGIIANGNTLSVAMEQCGQAFPSLMINMYKSGESSGKLDETAMKMAAYYTAENRLNQKIKSAMAYPTLLAIMTVCITLGLFTIILPEFFEIFEQSGVPLNIVTRGAIAVSNFIVSNWIGIGLFCGAFAIIWSVLSKVESVALAVDELRIKLPKIGKLCCIIYSARFARTLSSLYSSGVSMLEAVEISVKTIGNRHIENQFTSVVNKISSGQALSSAITGVEGIEKKLVSTIFIGEESGRLDEVLTATSEEYEFESDMAIEKMLTYIEPIMIVIMAVIVGTVMIAVMVPVMDMSKTIV